MAKMMVSVCLAACLIIALAADIVRATDGVDDKAKARDEIKEIEAIEAVEESERTRDQWETLAQNSIVKLAKKGASRMSTDKITKHVETLREAQKHLQPEVSLLDLGMPANWLDLLSVQERSLECSGDLIDTMAYFAVKGKKWQISYALDHFGQYLSTCGHEALFKKAIGNFNHWNQTEYPTLDSYLRAELFSHSFTYVDRTKEKLAGFLTTFKELAEFGGATACSNNQKLVDSFANLVFGSRVKFSQLYGLIRDYFELYLQKCSLGESLRQVMAEHGIALEGSASPVAAYTESEFFRNVTRNPKSAVEAILFALQIVSKNEFNSCNAVILNIRRRLANEFAREHYTEYVEHFSEVFTDHSTACVNEFKAKAATFGQQHSEHLQFIEKLAKRIGDVIAKDGRVYPGGSRRVIEYYLRSLVIGVHPDVEIVEGLRQACKAMWGHMEPTIEALSYDHAAAKEDKQVRDFMNYLGYCSYPELDMVPDLKRTRGMFNDFQVPYYTEGVELNSDAPVAGEAEVKEEEEKEKAEEN